MKLPNRLHSFAPYFLAMIGYGASANLALAVPTLPNINTNNVVNITNFGSVSSTTLTNTTAIQNAINFASATNGGATVEFPAGTFLSGPLTLQSKVNLQIDSGATLQFLSESKYPDATGSPAYPIAGTNLTDLEISGSGTIDGNGAGWWSANPGNRPYMIYFTKCVRVLIQNVTLQNPPKMHIVFKNGGGNITIQGITINTTAGNAANTDGIDLVGTNCLIQNCTINAGDDNIAIGSSSSSAVCNNILVTNCTFGSGHGVSLGSNTQSGVSNLTVINCTFNGTDNGIRMKSDNLTSGGAGEGGMAQNLYYYNIGMTNIKYAPIIIYSYYDKYGNPTSPNIPPATAAATNAATITSFTPVWRNIVISNLTATAGQPGIIWARTEMPATNIILSKLNITATGTFDLYHAKGIQISDSQFQVGTGNKTFTLFDAQVVFTNTSASTNLSSLDGLTTNSYGNSFAFYNAQVSTKNTNVLDDGPFTLADSILMVSNDFVLVPSTVLNFTLDPNTNRVAVAGNLALGGTINLTNGPGFGPGTNTLLTYTGTLSGNLPTLGSTPAGYNYAFDTNTAGQVKLVVTLPAPSAPTNLTATGTNLLIKLKWNAVSGATSYNLKRGTASGGPYPTVFSGLTVTNYSDAAVTNAVTYYYVVTAVSGGESTNSLQASAAPLPSSVATNIVVQVGDGQLQLSWPQDHLGWHLQIQTNSLNVGLGANWVNVPNSTTTNQIFIPINPNNGSVFLRLVYP
jgi:polygalacturonase